MIRSRNTLTVLIETYWNVNIDLIKALTAETRVLIETYWNVNNINQALKVMEMWVLIETYWNVNSSKFCRNSFLSSSLNRNILECKYELCRCGC